MASIETALGTYFSADQIEKFTVSGNTASAGGVVFRISDGIVSVEKSGDEWLTNEVKNLTPDRAAWCAAAWLKVRHFATPAEITAMAKTGEIYNEDYYTKRGGGSPYVNYPIQESGFDGTAAFNDLADEIIKKFKPKTALDCGCATGVLVKALQDRGVDARGIDISEYATSHAVAKAVFRAPGDRLPFAPNTFDLVISQDFMEHIDPSNIGAVLKEQARVTKPVGVIAHFIPFEPDLDTPRQSDVHLCEANRAFWIGEIKKVPGLTIEHTPPEADQWSRTPGETFDRYFIWPDPIGWSGFNLSS